MECIQDAKTFAKTLPAYTSTVEICLLDNQQLNKFRNKKQKAWGKTGALKGIRQMHVWKKESDGKIYIAKTSDHEWTIVK